MMEVKKVERHERSWSPNDTVESRIIFSPTGPAEFYPFGNVFIKIDTPQDLFDYARVMRNTGFEWQELQGTQGDTLGGETNEEEGT